MAQFLTRLMMQCADNSDDGKWIVCAPLVYRSDVAARDIEVPTNFPTDLASVPRLPVIYFLCGGTANEAAVIHDFLYTSTIVPRAVADAVLREASLVTGVVPWRAWLMWAGVRLGGKSHYGK
jgi:hypothetical protein